MLLDKIEKANDIKKIDKSDYGELAEEIRQFLIQKISVTGDIWDRTWERWN